MYTQDREVKAMLDLVKDLSYDINAKFLEPACGDGNFLIEILKRKMQSLDKENGAQYEKDLLITVSTIYAVDILQDNINESISRLYNHIEKDYIDTFKDDIDDDILLSVKEILNNNIICGDTLTMLKSNGEPIVFDMKFDVIIGNPPYQMNTGGGQAQAVPLYHKFIETAKDLEPQYISMIIPSRWMVGGMGLNNFRRDMLNDRRIIELHDYTNAKECFPNVDIKGGVCYFLWKENANQKCNVYTHENNNITYSKRYLIEDGDDIFIRNNILLDIKNKAQSKNEEPFEDLVSSLGPYGLNTDFFKKPEKYNMEPASDEPIEDGYSILGLIEGNHRTWKYIDKDYALPKTDGIDKYKIFISEAYGCGAIGETIPTPVLATPGQLCTQTFLQIGVFNTQEEAENCLSYIKTKFFRILIGARKTTQHATKKVYRFVPMQDFSKPWTDEELYEKYGLTDEEINYIEEMIKPMK